MDQALSDVTVIDLGQVIAMPFCTMLLADMGARVIKVESRERGRERVSLGVKRVRDGVEERVPAAQYRDRNKLGITLELKTPEGAELFKELVARADVVTENWSVGTMERLGLGYEDLKQVNPRLVYASITAFGQNGPYAEQRGYDMLAQAISGYMSITGFPEHPPTRSGQSISDYYAGMLCAFSIMSALHYRDRSGKGQRIDLALLDSLLIALDNLGERYTVGGELLTRAGNVSFAGSSSGVYPTTDGHVAVVAGASNAVWKRFCEIIGRADLVRDPGFATGRGAARPPRRDRRHHPGLDQRALQGRGGRHAGGGGRSGGARQQRRRDGRRSPGAGARDVRRGRPPRLRTAQDDGHAAQAVGDARPDPLARPAAGRAQRGGLRRHARPLAGRPRALARGGRDLSHGSSRAFCARRLTLIGLGA